MSTQRLAVLKKTCGRCGCCGCDLTDKKWQIDHIEPIRRGNQNHPKDHSFENLMAACPQRGDGVCCEDCRSNMSFEEVMRNGGLGMILCPDCGNKRCPKAVDHLYQCTGSNAVGQVGELEQ